MNPNSNLNGNIDKNNNQNINNNNNKFNTDNPPGFVKVKPSSLTEIHPVLDYDNDEYYDDDDASGNDNGGGGGGFPGETIYSNGIRRRK